ncbi:hypothetical protein pah_c026o033 [Parachlamydia acanthamoebae str. Hall's coccus]|nr:hypothetical protein pah_c026o033 [Parachlamydia acanthamoebae str. Hall's coccus]
MIFLLKKIKVRINSLYLEVYPLEQILKRGNRFLIRNRKLEKIQ